MGKANISFPDGMLEEIDRRAEAAGITRSAFVQEATATYIARADYDVEREERRQRIERAQQHMAELGRALPPGPDGATIIRRMRDAVPEWLPERKGRGDE
jgi:DNA-binding transcriptional MocR family regulator